MQPTNDEHAGRTHLTVACENCPWSMGTSYFTNEQIEASPNAIAMHQKNLNLFDMLVDFLQNHYRKAHNVELSQ